MGDTNCRYTREKFQELMIDALNADSRFDAHDPWIDFPRQGIVPDYGWPITGVDGTHEGRQLGEVVDKVVYVNNTDAPTKLVATGWLHDDSFTDPATGKPYSDHFPVTVNFTIGDKDDATMPAEVHPTVPQGELAGDYFLRNVGTGLFLCPGLNWGTHAMVGNQGVRVRLRSSSTAGKYHILTTLGYFLIDGSEIFIDNTSYTTELQDWQFVSAQDGKYVITRGDNKAVGVGVKREKRVQYVDYNLDDPYQQWELVTEAQLRATLNEATSTDPVDASFLIRGGKAWVNDNDIRAGWHFTPDEFSFTYGNGWYSEDPFEKAFVLVCSNPKGSIAASVDKSKTHWTLQQVVNNLPAGYYTLTFQACSSEAVKGTINGTVVNIPGDQAKEYSAEQAAKDFATPTNKLFEIKNFYIGGGNPLDIKFEKTVNSEQALTAFKNFTLLYYGEEPGVDVPEDLGVDLADKVFLRNRASGRYVNFGADYGTRATMLDIPGCTFFPENVENVPNTYKLATKRGAKYANVTNENGDVFLDQPGNTEWTFRRVRGDNHYFYIESEGMYLGEMALPNSDVTVAQLRTARPKDQSQQWEILSINDLKKEIQEQATKAHPADATFFISTPLFNHEENYGDYGLSDGWTLSNLVSRNNTVECDRGGVWGGTFNYCLGITHVEKKYLGSKVIQKWKLTYATSGLPNGKYRLTYRAILGNFSNLKYNFNGTQATYGWEEGAINDGTADFAAAIDKLADDKYLRSAEFNVTDGNLSIVFDNTQGHGSATSFYLDDLKLEYLGPDNNAINEMIIKAIRDANAKIETLPAAQQEGWDAAMAPYYQIAENPSNDNNGYAEVAEIYNLLKERTFTQTAPGSDFTPAIINNSFERNDDYGWSFETRNDTGIRENSNGTYQTEYCDGSYLYNTWDNTVWGATITQTITDLPAGKYTLKALLASDKDAQLTLFANEDNTTTFVIPESTVQNKQNHQVFYEVSVPFVYNPEELSELTIGVRSNSIWYKADNFRLTFEHTMYDFEADATYDKVYRTAEVSLSKINNELISDGDALVSYAVTTGTVEPKESDFNIYDGDIDLSVYAEDETTTVSVWVKAQSNNEYYFSLEHVKVLQTTVEPMGETLPYSPVAANEHLQHGWWYMIGAVHSDGYIEIMGRETTGEGHNVGCRIKVNDKNQIVGDESGLDHVHEFELNGDTENGWTLSSKHGDYSIGSTVSRAASGAAEITLGGTAGFNLVPANISVDGDQLGYDPDSHTFGFAANHTEPVVLFTSGGNINTGVDNISADNVEVEYYNLQGIRVTNPDNGIYIRRQGSIVTKVLIKK